MSEPLRDRFDPRPTLSRTERFAGLRWDIVTDAVLLHDGQEVVRDFVQHPGAVGIVALDEHDRMLLIQQYRHPVGSYLWEAPAGLMDVAGEPALDTAKRELLEETGIEADTWHVLADWFNSPGGSSEGFRCFLARDLREAPGGRPQGHGEEAGMPVHWVPLEEVVAASLRGDVHNPTTLAGSLATWAARERGWRDLRPGDAPWPAREHLVDTGRVWTPPEPG